MNPRRSAALAAVLTVSALVLTGCFNPLSNGSPPTATDQTSAPDVDDFDFASFDASYTLGRDADGLSTLTTVETLVPVFPEYDQNRGIARAIPADFDGHSTELSVLGVTDEAGNPREFEVERDGEFVLVVMAVPPGGFVHGEQTYVLTYEQRGVIGDFDDHQEFYWDVNGTGWGQPFAVVSADIELQPGLEAAVIDAGGCWFGPQGSTDRCALEGAEGRYSAEVSDLGPGENLTVALFFTPGTFTG